MIYDELVKEHGSDPLAPRPKPPKRESLVAVFDRLNTETPDPVVVDIRPKVVGKVKSSGSKS